LIDVVKTKEVNAYYKRSQFLFRKNDFAGALKDCNKALTFDRDNADLLLLRSRIYLAQGKSKEPMAMNDLKKVTEMNPKNQQAWDLLAEAKFKAGKWEEAKTAIDKSIALGETAEAVYMRSKCHYKLGNTKACCSDLNRAKALGHAEAAKDLAVVCK
jgi:tetratricopeptide (TPR) repeat protein